LNETPQSTTVEARAAVLRVKREGSSLGNWMSGLETRTARYVVILATANKLARISWAVLASGNDYSLCTELAWFPTRGSGI
jgi:transposase